MDNRLLKVKNFLSFEPSSTSSEYELSEVNQCVVNKLLQYYNEIENADDYKICLRGDSRKNETCHKNLFENELAKIFIVGEKSKAHIENSSNSRYNTLNDANKSQLLAELPDLISEVNNEITARSDKHNITGVIPDTFFKSLGNSSMEELLKWKVFFLSFLHNSGKNQSFSNYSPFISLTYGYKKYVTARRFALQRSRIQKGIVFLFYLNNDWPYQIRSKNLSQKLRAFGVKWYSDINTEIMLINGMYPHHLLGIFEVERFGNPKFIINPWLYKMIIDDSELNYSKGININQQNFKKFASQAGYSHYFFNHIDEQNQYTSAINQFQYIKTPEPPQGV